MFSHTFPSSLSFRIVCTMSLMLSDERKGSVEEACLPPRETSFKSALKRRWNYFHKPLLSILIGALVFGTGTAMSLLYFTHVGNVPYLVGPLFLSMGLMFLVTGLVWIPIIKQKMFVSCKYFFLLYKCIYRFLLRFVYTFLA
uniref:Uncharacterized protein n=1 Tax=Astyanax mexicanus TaxID=7994 RepID=A0A3B1JD14_ASTMX